MCNTRPLEVDYPPLMICQLDALRAYASAHGAHWKDDLRWDWADPVTDPKLSRLRQTHGSVWLRKFQLRR
jgi:hypothetical protein